MNPLLALLFLAALGACAAPPRQDEPAAARSTPTGVTLGGSLGSFYGNTTSR